jgi:hypothetical protein
MELSFELVLEVVVAARVTNSFSFTPLQEQVVMSHIYAAFQSKGAVISDL